MNVEEKLIEINKNQYIGKYLLLLQLHTLFMYVCELGNELDNKELSGYLLQVDVILHQLKAELLTKEIGD